MNWQSFINLLWTITAGAMGWLMLKQGWHEGDSHIIVGGLIACGIAAFVVWGWLKRIARQ